MRARTGLFTLVSGAFLLLGPATADPAAVPALPATPPAAVAPGTVEQHIRGTVTAFDGTFLTLKTTERKSVTLGVTTDTRIVHNRTLRLTDLGSGAYVGVALLKAADGKLRALGIRVYPATMRGQGEGEYPIDPANPARLLLNGTIGTVTPGGIGGTLTVAFQGASASAAPDCTGRSAPGGCSGSADIQFARGVPIISIEGGDVSLLLPGAFVSAAAAPDINGTPVATAITVERDAPAPKITVTP
jgi:hypothetical protein